MRLSNKIKLLFSALVFFGVASGIVSGANISRFYLEGPKTTLAPNSDVVFSVFLDSVDSVNAFDLEIKYPRSDLEFLNSDNTGSIVDIWKTKPALLANGNVGFSGGIIKPFLGNRGFLVKLAFKALKASEPGITFGRSDIYLADGKGTKKEILSENLSISIKENAKVVSTPITPFQETESDKIIEQNLDIFKSQATNHKVRDVFIPLILIIILVICAIWVYNKRKPKY